MTPQQQFSECQAQAAAIVASYRAAAPPGCDPVATMVWVGVGTAVLTTGASLYSSSQQKKAAEANAAAMSGIAIDPAQLAAILGSVQEYQPVNVNQVVTETAQNNFNQGTGLATRTAKKFNAQAVSDTIDAMNRLHGGKDKYDHLRDGALGNIEDHIAGQLSSATRQQLGRRLLANGTSELGDGAVDDLYTGYIGQTQEGLTTQGGDEFKSLYTTFRQAAPLINGQAVLDRFTISPDNAVQAEIANAQNQYQSSMGIAGLQMQGLQTQYQSQYNQGMMQVGTNTQIANANAQMAAGIAQGVGSAAGAYAGSRNGGVVQPTGAAVGTTSQGVPIYNYSNGTGHSTTAAKGIAIA